MNVELQKLKPSHILEVSIHRGDILQSISLAHSLGEALATLEGFTAKNRGQWLWVLGTMNSLKHDYFCWGFWETEVVPGKPRKVRFESGKLYDSTG